MCLSVDPHHHPEGKPLVAEHDILVWKHLTKMKMSGVFVMVSPFQMAPYTFGRMRTARIKIYSADAVCERFGYSYVVREGLHAHLSHHGNTYENLFPAIIPKGSEYFVGLACDIASDTLVVYTNEHQLSREHEFYNELELSTIA